MLHLQTLVLTFSMVSTSWVMIKFYNLYKNFVYELYHFGLCIEYLKYDSLVT